MTDLNIQDDPFSTDFELSRPISTVTVQDGEPFDFVSTPTKTSISPELIELVESWGRQCPGFFTRTDYLGQLNMRQAMERR